MRIELELVARSTVTSEEFDVMVGALVEAFSPFKSVDVTAYDNGHVTVLALEVW